MIEVKVDGVDVLLANSRRARKRFARTVFRSIRKSMRKPITARRRMTRLQPTIREILKTPWGKGKRGKLSGRVKMTSFRVEDNTVMAGLGMYGYAAAARTGDRIPPHAIVRGSEIIAHPGAVLVPQISGGRDFQGEASEILANLERDVKAMLDRFYAF